LPSFLHGRRRAAKTALSFPDGLFHRAKKAAKKPLASERLGAKRINVAGSSINVSGFRDNVSGTPGQPVGAFTRPAT
jgi:hypothetical protein